MFNENELNDFAPTPDGLPPEPGQIPPPPDVPSPGPSPREVTPMMLMRDVQKLFSHFIRAEHEQVNIQNSYRHLLFHLAHRDGCTQLQLAKLTHLKPPTVSVTLHKMEHDGYVTRRSDENDLRQTLVFLTDKGREYNNKIGKRIDELEKLVMNGFSDEETAQLISLLSRMRDNLSSELEPNFNCNGEHHCHL